MRYMLIALLTFLCVACQPNKADSTASASAAVNFFLTDVTGADFGKTFALNDHHGQPKTLQSYQGKVVLLFFGFTHCPDVCPTSLFKLKQAMDKLGAEANQVQVLFVTLDPNRDTPEKLAQYVPAFHPSFVGLSADEAQIAKVAADFKVVYSKQNEGSKNYTLDHTAYVYVYDKKSNLRLFYRPDSNTVDQLVQDIKTLLKG